MSTVQIVRCPNCGSLAERQLLSDRRVPIDDQVIQTACPVCDYLMVMSVSTGSVIEAYAPGRSSQPSHYSPIASQPRLLVQTI
ncbi:MAG: replication restart DNA helicase PriA [Cyanobacteria bacterium P01_A01_bin.123]